LTIRQKTIFRCFCRLPMFKIFFSYLNRWFRPTYVPDKVSYYILKYRMMISLFSIDEVCCVCQKACLDRFEEHVVYCRELSGFKYKHDLVRDVLFDVFRCAWISSTKEAPVNFLTNTRWEIYFWSHVWYFGV
jgi:hypothetical protein